MQMTLESYFEDRLGDSQEYSPKEVAAMFGVGKTTIYRYIESGRLPAVRLFGYRISRGAIADFISKSSFF
jgi:excisionase family DNA binding protein